MLKTTFCGCVLFGLLLATPALADAETDAPFDLHKELGDVIAPEENAAYNFFGEISGFTGARLMRRSSGFYAFMVLRNVNDSAQLFFVDMGKQKIAAIRAGIHGRISTTNEKMEPPVTPLFPIAEKAWSDLAAQHKVILQGGSRLLGAFVKAHGDTIFMQTRSGLTVPLPTLYIRTIQDEHVQVVDGKFYRSDPNSTRLFFGPTGRRLKAGRGYFADYYIFFPTVAFGITDNFSVAGGVSLIPGAPSQLIYFMPKLTFQASEKIGVGTGVMFLLFPGDTEGLSLGYAAATFGSNRGGLTLGAGVPFGSSSMNSPVLLIGAEAQLSNSAKLITENWIFFGDESMTLLSGGIRFFSDRIAVDLAFLTSPEVFGDSDGFPFLPWVSFSVIFGK